MFERKGQEMRSPTPLFFLKERRKKRKKGAMTLFSREKRKRKNREKISSVTFWKKGKMFSPFKNQKRGKPI